MPSFSKILQVTIYSNYILEINEKAILQVTFTMPKPRETQ